MNLLVYSNIYHLKKKRHYIFRRGNKAQNRPKPTLFGAGEWILMQIAFDLEERQESLWPNVMYGGWRLHFLHKKMHLPKCISLQRKIQNLQLGKYSWKLFLFCSSGVFEGAEQEYHVVKCLRGTWCYWWSRLYLLVDFKFSWMLNMNMTTLRVSEAPGAQGRPLFSEFYGHFDKNQSEIVTRGFLRML